MVLADDGLKSRRMPIAVMANKVDAQVRRNREGLGGGHCVLKWGFTRTFPRNQDVTVKLKSELIFIKF